MWRSLASTAEASPRHGVNRIQRSGFGGFSAARRSSRRPAPGSAPSVRSRGTC